MPLRQTHSHTRDCAQVNRNIYYSILIVVYGFYSIDARANSKRVSLSLAIGRCVKHESELSVQVLGWLRLVESGRNSSLFQTALAWC